MANVILKFQKNKKAKDRSQLIGFFDKKVHFIAKDSENQPRPGENWECFIWHQSKHYNLVKPFKKIRESELKEEQARVDFFNKSIEVMEKLMEDNKEDFKRIVFDEKNKPWLESTLSIDDAKKKFNKGFLIKIKKEKTIVRPILTSEDKKAAEEQAK